jgi:hypothetical protein
MHKKIFNKFLLSLLISTTFLLNFTIFKVSAATDNNNQISESVKSFIDSRLKLFLDKNTDINTFVKLYNKNVLQGINLSKSVANVSIGNDKFEKLQLNFGKRLRDAKNVIGRDYYKNETSVTIKNIKLIDTNIYEVDAIETTKLYFKQYDNTSTYEAYSDEHILKVANINNKQVFLNEDMPNSLIGIDSSNVNIQAQNNMRETEKNLQKSLSSPMATALATSYNRTSARAYADTYWNNYNTSTYRTFDPSDCTNYISQCIKNGFNGTQDSSGSRKWFYNWPGYVVDVGYTVSWGAAQNSYEYWWYGQQNTTKYSQTFSTPPSNWTQLPSNDPIWNYALDGNPVFYHTDPNSTVYYNHAGIITGKVGTLDDFGNLVTWRPVVNCHTNNRYKSDYTLYPYVDYSGLISNNFNPTVTLINIPDWSPFD